MREYDLDHWAAMLIYRTRSHSWQPCMLLHITCVPSFLLKGSSVSPAACCSSYWQFIVKPNNTLTKHLKKHWINDRLHYVAFKILWWHWLHAHYHTHAMTMYRHRDYYIQSLNTDFTQTIECNMKAAFVLTLVGEFSVNQLFFDRIEISEVIKLILILWINVYK